MEPNPHTHTIMTAEESITKGGEIGFVRQLIEESAQTLNQTILFTSLVGRKKSIKPLLRIIKENGFPFMGSFVLFQGKTLRWCLCWTYNPRYGQVISKDPLHYKLFAKKKLHSQLNDIHLHFPFLSDIIHSRIQEFCTRCNVSVLMIY